MMTFSRRWLRRAVLGAAVAISSAVPAGATSAAPPNGPDLAARGLDAFLVGPTWAVPGSTLTFAVRAIGYPSVADGVPLPGARISAVWDAVDVPDAKPVTLTADARALATLSLVMPPVKEKARLLVTVEHGGHARTRTFEVEARADREVEVVVPDASVVPGSKVGAWVRVRDRSNGRRVDGVPLLVEMVDGGIARDRVRATTDSTGSALVALRVPEHPVGWTPEWSIRATLVATGSSGSTRLSAREEVVDQPWMAMSWDDETAFAGDTVRARVRLRDAAGEAIAGEAIEWVVTPLDPGDDAEEDWARKKVSTTDIDGVVTIEHVAPAVSPGGRLRLRLSARTTDSFARSLAQHADLDVVAQGAASLDVIPEGKSLVPGVPQRIFVRARGDDGAALRGPARLSGDGLDALIELDARGEAEVTWTPPVDVGSRRDVGGCARSVAASVTLTDTSGRLARRGHRVFDCVVVDRARSARLEIDPPIARAGARVHVRVIGRDGVGKAQPFALEMAPREGGGTPRAVWIDDGAVGADVTLPDGPSGAWSFVAFGPRDGAAAVSASTNVLVAPKVLPRIKARVVGGRIVPSGHVEIEARLVDEAGRPIEGLVAGLVYDAFGGGNAKEIERLDTHVVLCEAAGVSPERCDDMWRGDAAAFALARSGLGGFATSGAPLGDPGGTARPALEAAFGETLRSLEGAVFEATSAPERLVDARRDRRGARTFNPELFRIVTEALGEPPVTPGGEPLELADLTAIDPQVTFDTVARRVTRLKVFRVLSAVRDHRLEKRLDLSEPALADPNLLLTLMTTRGELDASALLDPWGGTMTFRRAGGAGRAPSIAALPGWELASPGPDGQHGSGDDVVDPFERVVKSGTPYARASGEDAVVLARADLRVHDATMSGWSALLEEKTGTRLGGAGFGSGSGRLGGAHRSRPPSVRMGATSVDRRPREPVWSLPVRTQGGVARFRLPLGEVDTTYRVVVAGLADGGEAAIADLEIPVTTAIAARIETGARWTTGDVVEVSARIRNRTTSSVRLAASFTATGAASIAGGTAASSGSATSVTVPARSSHVVRARVRANRPGEGVVELRLVGEGGRLVDAVRAAVPVVDPGRPVVRSRARFISGEGTIPTISLASDERAAGPQRLVVEGSVRESLLAALESLDPDREATADALVDTIEAAVRVETFAREDGEAADALASRAASARERATGRLRTLRVDAREPTMRRAMALVKLPSVDPPGPPCGDDAADPSGDVGLALLEAEPEGEVGAASSCWDGIAESVKRGLDADDVVGLARLVAAFAERAQHRADARLLAARLATKVSLDANGRIALSGALAERRDARSIVYAALLRASAVGATLPASKEALLGWLLVQRDARGGFGSARATRLAVAGILGVAPRAHTPEPVRVARIEQMDDDDDVLGGAVRFDLSPTASRRPRAFSLDPRATSVLVSAPRSGALVRVERTVLVEGRPATEVLSSPLRLELTWPRGVRAGTTAKLGVVLRTTDATSTRARVIIPLPPGVSLAEAVADVRMIPGALVLSQPAAPEAEPLPTRLPLRFALAGDVHVPEASATPADAPGDRVFAASPRLVVSP